MKKSPLSTPSGHGGNFQHGRGRRRGYGYNQMRNDNDNFHRFSGPNNMTNNQFEGDMIPLDTSSPVFHNNRGNRRQSNDRRNQRFSNTGISGSYNNQRNNLQLSPGSPYSPQKYQRNHQQQNNYRPKNDPGWHRQLPISEFIDIKSIFEDPWAELESEFANSKCQNIITTTSNDSSVEVILERNGLEDSSLESVSDETTINISSSYEVKEGSSVDLPLENMNFSRDSKDSSILSESITSQVEQSLSEKVNQSQDDSVVEIVY